MANPRVLLVGGGVTAAAIAAQLSKLAEMSLTCWDKAKRPGGRMTTHRCPTGGPGQVDLGPQFITSKTNESDYPEIRDMVEAGVLLPVSNQLDARSSLVCTEDSNAFGVPVSTDDITWAVKQPSFSTTATHPFLLFKPQNYVAPRGVEAVAEFLWSRAGVRPLAHHRLDRLNHRLADGIWVAESEAAGRREEFDMVLLTLPVPQFAGIPTTEGMVTGNFLDEAKASGVFDDLLRVRFFPSFSLGLFYSSPTELGLGWKWKYFPDSPVIRFIAVDTLKRGDFRSPSTLCVQSQRGWAREHVEMSKEAALPLLLAEVDRLLPGLPRPTSQICHKWRFSQIRTPFPGTPGCVLLQQNPLLLAAGDSFTYSNLAGCLDSAREAVSLFTPFLSRLGTRARAD